MRFRFLNPLLISAAVLSACLEVPPDVPADNPRDSDVTADSGDGDSDGFAPSDASGGADTRPDDGGMAARDASDRGGRADAACQDECQPGDAQCITQPVDPPIYQTCRVGEDGCFRFHDDRSCQPGQRCSVDDGCYCIGLPCTDGEFGCRGTTVVVCSYEDNVCGAEKNVMNCAPSQGLDCEEGNNGECTVCDCIPGHERCLDGMKENCVDSGAGCAQWIDGINAHATAQDCADRTIHCDGPADCETCGAGWYCPN